MISQKIKTFIETSAFGELITALRLLEAGLGTRAAIDQTIHKHLPLEQWQALQNSCQSGYNEAYTPSRYKLEPLF